uniref:Uncharacterized protein n=1 Tax=Minutocellus polymorphus TaxID=265543 RepID=A0A7S0AX18_9STRA|mmetsp:Transcript_5889/g.9896  ORF Transcript_5889/g.9896 Transcript_5889/m.9896 type:complete len:250 (+) Transcript_5889:55-804(+)|eukprot:CAMPEP_0197718600 /NCGR_PEP_ID=MMETSP1434-20131217/2696_1 /TAXON_ID=265543 /ORGANISM="Minutocellus polymorphus, Strain CCMP3303" /LENGTH=249 /DNA_ID=CAMNT_0043303275 /DNA_START=42 /DNA_END=791 /DNA_ORIENTATION=+
MADPNVTASIRAAAARRLEDEIGADLGEDEPFASSALDPSRSMSISRLGASVKNVVATPPEQKAAASSKHQASDEDAEYLGRTSSEWYHLIFEAILAVVLIVIAFATWSDCDVIPSLSANVAMAGISGLLLAVAAFAWRVERLRDNGDGKAPDGYLASPALVAHDFLSGFVVAIAVWGAVLTFGNWPMMGMGGEGQCNSALYISAFVSSVITLLFALYYIGEECWETTADGDDDESTAAAAPAAADEEA